MSGPVGRDPHWSEAHVWRPDVPEEDTAPKDAPVDELDTTAWHTSPSGAPAMLAAQMCPVCGEGPWKSPLNHVSRKHGIDRFTMRDVSGLTVNDKVVDPDLSERFRLNNIGRDMTKVNEAAAHRKKPRRTREGLRRNLSALQEFNQSDEAARQKALASRASKSPEARAKHAEAMRRHWEGVTDEERAEHGRRAGGTPEHMKKMREAVVLQGCGTVASYKRGCRCEECRAAKRASRTA